MELTKLMSRVCSLAGGGRTLFCLISFHVEIRCYIDANHDKITTCEFTVDKTVGALARAAAAAAAAGR